jgi:hypothetical protein
VLSFRLTRRAYTRFRYYRYTYPIMTCFYYLYSYPEPSIHPANHPFSPYVKSWLVGVEFYLSLSRTHNKELSHRLTILFC